ncbi:MULTISPECIES: response regulator [Deinococcus]|uniref:Response regulator n=1 Tax=Deinococcus rufus TaxID=2136097 RepID=A0ABV7Z796_9DEIO|nr:response regulator [Deinococcus sp. AB2017081]WQE96300.1 response regulator [Deinococcus sp. AB2017081]
MTGPASPRPAVLIVDDSPGVLTAMERLLSPHLTVQVADSATAALRAVTADTGLVLADIRMPGMDGLELARALHQGRPSLPVVLMTGVVEDGLRIRARELGALDVLRKPLRSETLLPALQEWLSPQHPELDLSASPPARPVPAAAGPRPAVPAEDPGVAAQTLLRPLTLLPGVISAALFSEDGLLLGVQGELNVQVGMYLRFLGTSASTLGTHLDAQGSVRAAQLEFGDRVLVACFRPGELLAVLVRDTPAASSVKAWVRQRWASPVPRSLVH